MTPESQRIRLANPSDVIAAVPTLIGFCPVESLVVVGTGGGPKIRITLRMDLPALVGDQTLADSLHGPLTVNGVHGVVLLVVADSPPGVDAPLPYQATVDVFQTVLTGCGIVVGHRLWVPAIAAGTPWRCYDEPSCTGVVPDPAGTVLAATAAAHGVITRRRREDLAAELRPAVPDHVLARRAERLAHLAAPEDRPALDLVDATVRAAAAGQLPDGDDDVVALAHALTDHRVRDAVLAYRDPGIVAAAELLWTALVRHTPAPARAEPAVCLAVAAYLRGEGTLAAIAVDTALAADPTHQLATLLQQALRLALPPARLRELIHTELAPRTRRAFTPDT